MLIQKGLGLSLIIYTNIGNHILQSIPQQFSNKYLIQCDLKIALDSRMDNLSK